MTRYLVQVSEHVSARGKINIDADRFQVTDVGAVIFYRTRELRLKHFETEEETVHQQEYPFLTLAPGGWLSVSEATE